MVFGEGETVELTREIGTDPALTGVVDEVDALGNIMAPKGLSAIEYELSAARPHERLTILEMALAKSLGDVTELKAAIVAETSTQTSGPESVSAPVVDPARPSGAKNTDADPA
jgi:hypothetical protein